MALEKAIHFLTGSKEHTTNLKMGQSWSSSLLALIQIGSMIFAFGEEKLGLYEVVRNLEVQNMGYLNRFA